MVKWAFVAGGAVGTALAVLILVGQDDRPIGDRITEACVREFGPDQTRINSCKIAAITKITVDSDRGRLDRVLSQLH